MARAASLQVPALVAPPQLPTQLQELCQPSARHRHPRGSRGQDRSSHLLPVGGSSLRGSSEIWALSSGCKNLHGAWARAQLYPGTAAHAGTDRAAHVAAQRRAGCWQLLLGIRGECPPRTPLPSTGTLGTAPPQWVMAWKWHSAGTPTGAAAGAAPWAHHDGRGTTGGLRTGGTTRVPCRGCTAMGAALWVHHDGRSPVGALRSLQCSGCPAVVAPPRVRCSGAVRAGTAAMPWAHAATAARPPPRHHHPAPGGSGQPTQQGSAQKQPEKGGAEIQPAEDPPSCERGAVPQPCSPGGGPARPPPPTAASGEEQEPGRRGKMLPPALSPD